MNKVNRYFFLLLQVGIFLISTNLSAQKTNDIDNELAISIQECSALLNKFKIILKSDNQKLYFALKPNMISNKINMLIPLGDKTSVKNNQFKQLHIDFIKKINAKLRPITLGEKTLSKSRIHKMNVIIEKETIKLAQKMSFEKREFFLNKQDYKRYKRILYGTEEGFIAETFNTSLVSYNGIKDILKYNFLCKPLRGFGALFLFGAFVIGASKINTMIDENADEKKIEDISKNEELLKKLGYKIDKNDSPVKRKTFLEQKKIKEKIKNLPAVSSINKNEKVSSLSQGGEGVSNCGVYAGFHMGLFLEEEEKEIIIDAKSRTKEWKKYWESYLEWVEKEKTSPTVDVSAQAENGKGNDFTGDYIGADVARGFFEKEFPKWKDKVHVTGYGHGEKYKDTAGITTQTVQNIDLLEKSITNKEYKELVITNIESPVNKDHELLRSFIKDWNTFLNTDSKAPLYCILSNNGHFIAVKYYKDNEGLIRFKIRDSSGNNQYIASHCLDVMKKLKEQDILHSFSKTAEIQIEYIPLDETLSLPEYIKKVTTSYEDLKATDPLILKIKNIIQENKTGKTNIYLRKEITTNQLPTIENRVVLYSPGEGKDVKRFTIEYKDFSLDPTFLTDNEDSRTDQFKENGTTETETWVSQNRKDWPDYVKEDCLMPLYKKCLEDVRGSSSQS